MTTTSVLESYIQLRKALTALRTAETKNLDFGQSQIAVLYKLSMADATMGELVELAGTDKASMTRTIASLVNAGLVRRKPDPQDGRVTRIELTTKGKAKAEIAKEVRDNIGTKLEHSLSASDRKAFVALTEKMIKNLNTAIQKE